MTATHFLGNLQFVSGLAPPALEEIGPYVFAVRIPGFSELYLYLPLKFPQTMNQTLTHTVLACSDAWALHQFNSPWDTPHASVHQQGRLMQVNEARWNVAFSPDFTAVDYSSLNFQSYVPEASCAGCSLTNDFLVTVNRFTIKQPYPFVAIAWHLTISTFSGLKRKIRPSWHRCTEACLQCRGYLAFLNLPIIQQNDALAFIPYTPLAIRQIVAGIEAVFTAVSFVVHQRPVPVTQCCSCERPAVSAWMSDLSIVGQVVLLLLHVMPMQGRC